MASPATPLTGPGTALRVGHAVAGGARGRTTFLVAATVLALIVLSALLAPVIDRYDPLAQDAARPFGAIGGSHPFGTDDLGRDLFSRVVHGGRISLGIAAGAALVALVIGTAWGFAAALRGGWPDELLMRFADSVMAVPQILFGLVCVSALGPSPAGLAVIIGALVAPTTARMARSVALTEISRDYFTAAVAYGCSRRRLVLRELLPNTAGPVAVQFAINVANAMLLEASLSFVGLGVRPPDASWGTLLQQGYGFLYQSTPYILFPGLAILLTVGALNVIADQLGGRSDRGRVR